ncbi:hypothetical protein [Longispora albida]|uniref:hypothetical protein n=1 Tax=Longispora albida TaxID=203523 RepID=UPI0003721FE4|nr:hypothetical protein [Longispora albida]
MKHERDDGEHELFDRLEREMTQDGGAAAGVTDLDAERARRRSGPADQHFEVSLDDDEDDGGPERGGGLVVEPVAVAGRREVIPSEWRGWANIRATVRYWLAYAGHVAAFHAVRLPWYAAQALFWAVVGVFRVAGRQIRWWWVAEQHSLRQAAADANDPGTWLKLHKETRSTRMWRFIVLGGEVLLLVLVLPVAWAVAPWWARVAGVVAAVAFLARAGRPADRRIVSAAVVTARLRRLSPDIVLRAYYAAGLGNPDRADKVVQFGSTMQRDASGTGSQVVIDLPYGRTFDDAVKNRGAIASGLDVSVNQVFLTRDATSHRRHLLWVADRDPLAIPAGKTPLLDCKRRSIWKAAPFGLDERGRAVELSLMWISVLIGAQPRKGKTFSARLLALYAALDPFVRLFIADGKSSPDWRKFALVAEDMVYGTHPTRDDADPVTHMRLMLRAVKAHILRVNEILSGLPVDLCPEGKLTAELARDPKCPDLRVVLLVLEEFQVYYELDDKDASSEIASLLSYIMAVGPSSGVVLLSASQKPSGVGGASNIGQLFTRFRDNHAARFALKCGNRNVSEAILGGDAYAEGIDASTLPTGKPYLGVGYLYGLTDDTPTVRTYLADHADAEKILIAARKHRETAGTLAGMAAGEVTVRETRDVLADVASVFAAGETGLQWPVIAARLAEAIPEHYADLSADAISAQCRSIGVRSVNVKSGGEVLKGAKLADVRAAIEGRDAA